MYNSLAHHNQLISNTRVFSHFLSVVQFSRVCVDNRIDCSYPVISSNSSLGSSQSKTVKRRDLTGTSKSMFMSIDDAFKLLICFEDFSFADEGKLFATSYLKSHCTAVVKL